MGSGQKLKSSVKNLKKIIILLLAGILGLAGCENTDVQLAAEAGLDAVKAMTLTDEAVQSLAAQSSEYSDSKHNVALESSNYVKRLYALVGDHLEEDGFRFNYKVYLSPEVNAFAMADGTIRIYSGLMDMMNDGELRFVIGHEMGHVAREHIRKKMQLALAGRALRKGIASQNNMAGDIARSHLGGFVEILVNAQFSQQEERDADDYGLAFLQSKGYEPAGAVAALRKLATLGNDHSFLASHPAPGKRADRLEGKPDSPEEMAEERIATIISSLKAHLSALYEKMWRYI
jgi:putative metalloprotease